MGCGSSLAVAPVESSGSPEITTTAAATAPLQPSSSSPSSSTEAHAAAAPRGGRTTNASAGARSAHDSLEKSKQRKHTRKSDAPPKKSIDKTASDSELLHTHAHDICIYWLAHASLSLFLANTNLCATRICNWFDVCVSKHVCEACVCVCVCVRARIARVARVCFLSSMSHSHPRTIVLRGWLSLKSRRIWVTITASGGRRHQQRRTGCRRRDTSDSSELFTSSQACRHSCDSSSSCQESRAAARASKQAKGTTSHATRFAQHREPIHINCNRCRFCSVAGASARHGVAAVATVSRCSARSPTGNTSHNALVTVQCSCGCIDERVGLSDSRVPRGCDRWRFGRQSGA
jgi:hypothetical protein